MTKQDLNQILATSEVTVMLQSTQDILRQAADDLDYDVMNAIYEVRESIEKALDLIDEYRDRMSPIIGTEGSEAEEINKSSKGGLTMTKQDLNQILATSEVTVMLQSTQDILRQAADDLDYDVMNAIYEVRESIEKALDLIDEYRDRMSPIIVAACEEEKSKC